MGAFLSTTSNCFCCTGKPINCFHGRGKPTSCFCGRGKQVNCFHGLGKSITALFAGIFNGSSKPESAVQEKNSKGGQAVQSADKNADTKIDISVQQDIKWSQEPSHKDYKSSIHSKQSSSLDHKPESNQFEFRLPVPDSFRNAASPLQTSAEASFSSINQVEIEAEVKRLRKELEDTISIFNTASQEVISVEHEISETDEAASSVEEEDKSTTTTGPAEGSSSEDLDAQPEATKKIKEMNRVERTVDLNPYQSMRYRKYTRLEIEEATKFFNNSTKIGEGGYGPVYRCQLDHTPVAVKVLHRDTSQRLLEFEDEIEFLCLIRHPHIVLLLGACLEYGCLVYEYMAKGNLEDCLFRKGNKEVIPWQVRFRIASEIAMGLQFLHQTKPEPIVHRDLKPSNILLGNHYVAKISDVGFSRLVPSIAESVTQSRVTSTRGGFCYIDPEYQHTGMLGVKSDVYSFGILLLQLITAKPARGISRHVRKSIENGTFAKMLDPAVPDWPVDEALCLARLALQCAQLSQRDRPDLGTEVLPELIRLGQLGDSAGDSMYFSNPSHISMDAMSDAPLTSSGSSKYQSSPLAVAGRQPSVNRL